LLKCRARRRDAEIAEDFEGRRVIAGFAVIDNRMLFLGVLCVSAVKPKEKLCIVAG
jgi:hypothetical protein